MNPFRIFTLRGWALLACLTFWACVAIALPTLATLITGAAK